MQYEKLGDTRDEGDDNDNEHSPHTPTPPLPDEPLSVPSTTTTPSPSTATSTSSMSGQPHYRSLQEVYDATSPLDFEEVGVCMLAAEEPTSFAEAEKEACWRHAMKEELAAIQDNETWEITSLPTGQRPIGLKWVYKLKKDPQGVVVKHKARLVAKGYVQKKGVDFEDVFAPVARLETVRLLIALAAQEGWEVHHMDVKSAFLNGGLCEEVYVSQPPGYVEEGNEHKVLKLKKALYGLRQAPRAWNSKLDKSLTTLGFERCPLEHAVYKRNSEGSSLLVGVYVDDLIILGSSNTEIARFKTQMKQVFNMSDLGLLSYYLGIEVSQKPQGITLCQSTYAAKILEKNGMADCNPSQTPMEPRFKISKVSQHPPVETTCYRSIIGCLRYLVNTRPYIAYAVRIASRYMEEPTTEHMAAVKQILRYIRGTIEFGCFYVRKDREEPCLVGYSDSDLAGDIDDRKSTSGVAYFLGENIISWVSQKQKIVALSSCEAEYIAASTAACQGIWLGRLLDYLRKQTKGKVTLKVDNKSAIALCKNPVYHDRSKHIDTRYHFIRECVENGKIEVEYVNTSDQLADILTKSLGRLKFLEMREKIRVLKVKL